MTQLKKTATRPFFPHIMNCNDENYDPYEALDEFLACYDLDEARAELYRMFKTALQNGDEYQDDKERSNLVCFFEQLSDVVLAANLIAEQKREEARGFSLN